MLIVLKLNKGNDEGFTKNFQKSLRLLVVRDRSMNPVITKMEHFVIIVKDLYLFAMVTEMLLHLKCCGVPGATSAL